MKKIISILLLSFCLHSFGQVNIGKSKSPINLYVSEFSSEVFESFKKTTTYFVIPENLDKSEVEKVISEIWTVTELKFISENEFKDSKKTYVSDKNSLIQLINSGYQKEKTYSDASTKVTGDYIVCKFKISIFKDIKTTKKGELKYSNPSIAEIFFTPTIRLRREVVYSGSKTVIGNKKKLMAKLNELHPEESGFYNYNLGYIKNYLQAINHKISNNEGLVMRDGLKDEEELKTLKNKTLYAPEWILKKYDAMKIAVSKIMKPEDLFSKYQHDYKVIGNEELNTKILNGEDFYYLMHTQFNSEKIISVIHSLTGKIIYLSHGKMAYNIQSSDLKAINKLIE